MALVSEPAAGAPAITAASQALGRRKETTGLTSLLSQLPLIPEDSSNNSAKSHCLELSHMAECKGGREI